MLHLIYEWMPADFSRFGLFEACVFALIAGAFYCETPAAGLLDHLDGWQRVYSDETAVVHIRDAGNAGKDGAFR